MAKIILSIFLISFFLNNNGFAQSMMQDPSKINVSELNDSQIMKIMSETEKRGLTESQAISIAQSRGMTQSQIDILKSRLAELKSQSKVSKPITTKAEDLLIKSDSIIKKPVIASNEEKRLFGFQLFNSENLTFTPNVNLPVSATYILGPGDEIMISVWGNSQQNYSLQVDKSGIISIPNVGSVRVGGYKFEEVQRLIHNRLASIYSDLNTGNPQTFVDITMGTLRSINVSVIGEVFNPGTYTLPGTSTAFNALYLSGGPNILGSFRDIRIIREGKVFKTLDVFDYLINGNGEVNCSLNDGDIIMVPSYEMRIRLGGELKRIGIFEAKKGETVSHIIGFAGGYTENAYKSRIELYRRDSKEYSFLDVDSVLVGSTLVQNGDSLHVGRILPRFSNIVTINGAVFHPGNFQFSESLTLSELIKKADGFKEDVFLNRGLISRQNSDLTRSSIYFDPKAVLDDSSNLTLEKNDVITIYSIFDLQEQQFIQVFGEVIRPGTFPFENGITLASAILMAKGFTESGSEVLIEVSRRLSNADNAKIGEPIVRLFQFQVGRDLKISPQDANFSLMPSDQIFVRKAPSYQERAIVKLRGEIIYSGDYAISSKKERLSDVINRAGGLSPDAYAKGAMLTRPIVLNKNELRIRQELMEKDSLLKFSDLTFEVVGIDLESILKNPGGAEDIYVQAGDELNIPIYKQTIKVSGEVANSMSVTFKSGMKAKKYINKAGGFALSAKKNRTYVMYPNGEADVTSSFLFIKRYPKVYPGSEIVVPPRATREPMTAGMWISIASGLASVALTVATIANLNK